MKDDVIDVIYHLAKIKDINNKQKLSRTLSLEDIKEALEGLEGLEGLEDSKDSKDSNDSKDSESLESSENKENIKSIKETDTVHYRPVSGLVLQRFDTCMLCNALCGEVTRYSMGNYLTGWLFCYTCKTNGLLARTVHRHMVENKIIPCDWIVRSTRFRKQNDDTYEKEHIRVLKFIGNLSFDPMDDCAGKKIFESQISDLGYYIFRMSKTQNQLYVKVSVENEKKEQIQYPVSLANLFAHNPGLYEEMLMCKNFTGVDSIIIGYDDMSDEIKLEIKKSYDFAKRFQSRMCAMEF